MFMRIDKLQADLPEPKKPDPNAAAALQELLGGKYGEMSTLGNYMFQSFNFRNKPQLRPFYSLVSAIFAEELGHVELVSTGIAMLNNGPGDPTPNVDVSKAPFNAMQGTALPGAFLSNGGGATPVNSNGLSWNTDMVTTTGNVIIDLLHNFHLECGARIHKLRVYETMKEPTGREVCGYLLVRGSVHAHAYALALKKLTGVEIEKMLPTPNINLDKIPECQKYLNEGSIVGCTRSAQPITARLLVSGATAKWHCPVTRPASSKSSTAIRTAAKSLTSSAITARSLRTTPPRRCST